MGEYIRIDGMRRKLGVYPDLTYIRHADLAALVAEGATTQDDNGLPPAEYLAAGEWRYRFPFPSEDSAHGAPVYEGFAPGYALPAPAGLVAELDHAPGCAGGATLEIVAQRPLADELATVVRCPACGSLDRLSRGQAHRFAAHNARADDAERAEVVARMLAGYAMTTQPLCEWKGCSRPALTEDLFCALHRACEDAIEVDSDGALSIRPGTPAHVREEIRKAGIRPDVADIIINRQSAITTLQAGTPAGLEWLQESLADDAVWLGDDAVAVDWRMAQAIVDGARASGLVVQE